MEVDSERNNGPPTRLASEARSRDPNSDVDGSAGTPAVIVDLRERQVLAATRSFAAVWGACLHVAAPLEESRISFGGQTLAELADEIATSSETIARRGIPIEATSPDAAEPRRGLADLEASALRGADGGNSFGLILLPDAARRERREAERSFLADAGDILSSSLDYEATLAAVTLLAVQGVADWCAVHELLPDGSIRRIALSHPDSEAVKRASDSLVEYSTSDGSIRGVTNVVRTGEPEYVAEVPDFQSDEERRDPRHLARLSEKGTHSFIIVPLRARGNILGALTLASASRSYGPRELAVSMELGQRAAVAIENARHQREAETSLQRMHSQAEQLQTVQAEVEVANARLKHLNVELQGHSQELEQAAENLRVLADASTLLGSSLDLDLTLRELARFIAPRLADWAFVEIPNDHGGIDLRAVHHEDPSLVRLARETLRDYPLDQADDFGTAKVLKTGEIELLENVSPEFLQFAARDERHREALRRADFRSILILPLEIGSRVIGCLSLAMSASDRRFSREDIPFLGELARRAALAIENSRLYSAEQEARRRAERAADRSKRLRDVASVLNSALTPTQVVEACIQHGLEALKADAGSLAVLDEEGKRFEMVHSVGYPAALSERYHEFPFGPGRPLSDAVIRREPVFVNGPASPDGPYPGVMAELANVGMSAVACAPVLTAARALGGLSYSFAAPQAFDEFDRTFLATLGEQTAQALARASLYEAEREARSASENLHRLTTALSSATTPQDVASVLMERGVVALGADAGLLAIPDGSGRQLEILASTGGGDGGRKLAEGPWALDSGSRVVAAAVAGEHLLLSSPEEAGDLFPGYDPEHYPHGASAAMPVTIQGASGGILLWLYAKPRRFSKNQVALLDTVARQCSQALERTRSLEAERRSRQEAEAANRAKTEFLSTMSHELQTPLNAIAGYVDLLQAGVRGPLSAVQLSDLGRIKNAEEVLSGLISDILNFARIESGKIEYREQEVDLRVLMLELEVLLQPQVRANELQFESHIGLSDTAGRVIGDPERIRQVLMNLLMNALKFTGAGGRVDLRVEDEDTWCVVRVEDTGRGIPANKLDAIFDPFVQLDRGSLPWSQQGVGLGLTISRELARGMAGDLRVESEPGKGSTFSLYLRRAPAN